MYMYLPRYYISSTNIQNQNIKYRLVKWILHFPDFTAWLVKNDKSNINTVHRTIPKTSLTMVYT